MIHVLILGANGQLARNTTRVFLRDTDVRLTLCLRHAGRLSNPDPQRVTALNPAMEVRRSLGVSRGRTASSAGASSPGSRR
jgi:hypothetical protein